MPPGNGQNPRSSLLPELLQCNLPCCSQLSPGPPTATPRMRGKSGLGDGWFAAVPGLSQDKDRTSHGRLPAHARAPTRGSGCCSSCARIATAREARIGSSARAPAASPAGTRRPSAWGASTTGAEVGGSLAQWARHVEVVVTVISTIAGLSSCVTRDEAPCSQLFWKRCVCVCV